jgi:hypothetical protein
MAVQQSSHAWFQRSSDEEDVAYVIESLVQDVQCIENDQGIRDEAHVRANVSMNPQSMASVDVPDEAHPASRSTVTTFSLPVAGASTSGNEVGELSDNNDVNPLELRLLDMAN